MARKKAIGSGKQVEGAKTASPPVLQFKIALMGSDPAIWRRIQVEDGTLEDLHSHIQDAMGWENHHLHRFEIRDVEYADPQFVDDGFGNWDGGDSTQTTLSDILPQTNRRFRFKYEYDFGDCWEHEILFEGRRPREPKTKYPLCVEGQRACPPEDIGGIWRYQDLLEALADPDRDCDDDRLDWLDDFDPEAFDPVAATKAMRQGLRVRD